MQTMVNVNRHVLLCIFLSFFSFGVAVNANAQSSSPVPKKPSPAAALAKLDLIYQQILDEYLTEHVSTSITNASHSELEALTSDQYPPLVNLRRIREHMPSLMKSTDQELRYQVLAYLYKHNDTASVSKFTERVKTKGTSAQKAKHYLLLAQYYWSRDNWKGTRAALTNVDRTSLVTQDQQYYYLLMGYALQQLKEHRKAYRYYRRIPQSSPYYGYAKLNEGTAYLRQGWWTEAFIEFESAIEAAKLEKTPDDLLDRIYVTLGFAQLTYEFYRDSRITLRNVSVESEYTNKALMGLGLSAAYQKDFAGAVNAFGILVKKPEKDVTVDEAMLLLPKAYEEIGNLALAMENYQNAINYYQAKLSQIAQSQKNLKNSSASSLLTATKKSREFDSEQFASGSVVPDYNFQNYSALLEMRKTASPKLTRKIDELLKRYSSQIKSMVDTSLKRRTSMVDSYLSQAKLGMAKLYDQE